ncbi:MAG TPA: HlyD family secretion protein [bacterium]|nr:HlyD family secretion protein [bacterium]
MSPDQPGGAGPERGAPGPQDPRAGIGGTPEGQTTGARSRSPSRLRTWAFRIALVAIAIAVFMTIRYFTYAATHPSTDDAFVQGSTVSISSKIFGRVSQVLVQGDQRVSAGQPLVVLDPTDAQIEVQQAEAALIAATTQVAQAQAALTAQRSETAGAVAQAQAADAAAGTRVPQSQTEVSLLKQQLTAQRAQTAAGLQGAEAQATAAAAQVATAGAAVQAARAARDRAEKDYARSQTLVAQGAIGAQQLDADKAAADVTAAQYDSTLAQLSAANDQLRAARAQVGVAKAALEIIIADQAQVEIKQQDVAGAIAQRTQAAAGVESARSGFAVVRQREAQVAAAQAQVAQAQAQLAAARVQLQETRISAPADGVVASEVSAQPGEVVQPNQPLLTLVFSSQKWVEANFKETQLRNMRVGQPAAIRVDLLGRTFPGHVERLGPATGSALSLLPPQNATGNYTKVVQRVPVRIAFDDPTADTLQVGLSVEVTVDTTRRAAVQGPGVGKTP